jgi:hypothetical protein
LTTIRTAALVLAVWAGSTSLAHAQYGYYRFPTAGGYGIATSYPGAFTPGVYMPYYPGYYSGFAGGYGYGLPGNYGYSYNAGLAPPFPISPYYYRNFGGFVYPNTPGLGAVGYGGFGYPTFPPYYQYYGVSPAMSMYQGLW